MESRIAKRKARHEFGDCLDGINLEISMRFAWFQCVVADSENAFLLYRMHWNQDIEPDVIVHADLNRRSIDSAGPVNTPSSSSIQKMLRENLTMVSALKSPGTGLLKR